MRKICVITGTRAEFGLLRPLIELINKDAELQLQLIATGMHLSPEFGYTLDEIIAAGFVVDKKVECLLSSDTSVGVSKTIALAISGFADALEALQPDLVVVLGDRTEILGAEVKQLKVLMMKLLGIVLPSSAICTSPLLKPIADD